MENLVLYNCMMNWIEKREGGCIQQLHELISIRDGYQEGIGFTRNDNCFVYI